MNPTQPEGEHCPEPTASQPGSAAENLIGILTSPIRFRANIAAQLAVKSSSTAPTRWRDKDPAEMTDAEFEIWSEEQDSDYAERERDAYISRQEACDNRADADTGAQASTDAAPGGAPGTAGQVLRDAAFYLERYGWIQGAYYDSTSGSFMPPACLVGAIGMVCYGGPVDAPAQQFDDPGFLDFEEAVLHLDRWLLVEDGSESYEFNDARGRRLEDVTRVLREAASRPAQELIDAIRVIDAKNADMAGLAELLKPCGEFGEQSDNPAALAESSYDRLHCPRCKGTNRRWPDVVASGLFCEHDWHSADSDGGDVR